VNFLHATATVDAVAAADRALFLEIMGCPHQRLPYASWRLQVFRQIFLPATELRAANTCRRNYSSTRNTEQKQDEPDRHAESTRQDKPEETTRNDSASDTTRPSQRLPQSPLITKPRNPQGKARKRPATPEEIDRLRRNPWAIALASPPRMCSATNTRIPRAFLGDWGLVRRPDSDTLWFMPIGLLKDELKAAEAAQKAESEDESIGKAVSEGDTATTDSKNKNRNKQNRPLRLLTLRLLDRLLLLKELTGQFVGSKKARIAKIIPFRWKYPLGPVTGREEKNMVWREDMPSFVLKHMRKEAVKQLTKACWQDKNVNTADGVWRVIELREANEAALVEGLKGMQELENMEWGGVLIMGPEKAPNTPSSSSPSAETGGETSNVSDETSTEDPSSLDPQRRQPHPDSCSFASPFPDYVTLPQRGRKVPVFDLTVLLSEADREELRRRHPRFQHNALYFRPGGFVTVEPMLALWRLKGFVMHDEEFLAQEQSLDG